MHCIMHSSLCIVHFTKTLKNIIQESTENIELSFWEKCPKTKLVFVQLKATSNALTNANQVFGNIYNLDEILLGYF